MTGGSDTIAAVATAPGTGGIGIVRVSGPAATAIVHSIAGFIPPARHASFARFRNAAGDVIDEGVVLLFTAPASFTGEDVVELQGHGGPVVLRELLSACLAAGARAARPGEFTERAFLNEKLDLAQAEAVADLIDAASTRAARSALRTLTGEYSARLRQVIEAVDEARALVESVLDFPEDDVAHDHLPAMRDRLEQLSTILSRLLAGARTGVTLSEGFALAIAGAPNVGKSSLLNRLARSDLAITSNTPGTTRDVVRADLTISGIPIRAADTAGLRETADEIEYEGIRRAREVIANADLILLVVDDAAQLADQRTALASMLERPTTVINVINKIDLNGRLPARENTPGGTTVALCAKTGAGCDLLEQAIIDHCAGTDSGEHEYTARSRHLAAITDAHASIGVALERLTEASAPLELVAEDLRRARVALETITGRVDSETLLGDIFSRFCIGK